MSNTSYVVEGRHVKSDGLNKSDLIRGRHEVSRRGSRLTQFQRDSSTPRPTDE